MENVSIIITHWAQNPERSRMMTDSIQSLLRTAGGSEIIVCDNGGSTTDSRYLLELCMDGHIASYTRYRRNMHLGFARNDALRRATGLYIVIADNDIQFWDGWLEACVEWLDSTPGKYLATPLAPDPMNDRSARWAGEANGWRLNTRAGSNVFVMKREAMEEIGPFQDRSTITGCRYNDMWVSKGYLMGVSPIQRAYDMGLRKGANWKTFEFAKL